MFHSATSRRARYVAFLALLTGFACSGPGTGDAGADVDAAPDADASAGDVGPGTMDSSSESFAVSGSLSPSPHDFGTVNLGETSAAQRFVVHNGGAGEVEALTVTFEGGDVDDFAIVSDTCDGEPLASNASCAIDAQFAPMSTGMKSTSLLVSSRDSGEVSAALTGTSVAPSLSLSPASHDFGDVAIGTVAEATFVLVNDGSGPSGVLSTGLSDADAAEFTIVDDACDGAALPAGESCSITVSFRPVSEGAKVASLDLATATDAVGASLSGNAVWGDDNLIVVSPAIGDFGSAVVGTVGDTVDFTLSNAGGSISPAIATRIAGQNPDDFHVVAGQNGCEGQQLSGGESCTLTVEFAPTAEGARTAELRIDIPTASGVAMLNGTALPDRAEFVIEPMSQNFGWVAPGGQSSTVTFTVENVSVVQSDVPMVDKGGPDPAEFHIVEQDCNARLDPGDTCQVDVRFEPMTTGSKAATLEVAAANADGAVATLQGTSQFDEGFGVTPTAVMFSRTINGGESDPATVILNNIGAGTTGVISVAVGSEYSIGTDTCDGNTLAGGESCSVDVRFTPQSVGTAPQNLTFTADPGAPSGLNVGLNGTSVPEFLFSPAMPDPYDFGSNPVGTTYTVAFDITNNDNGMGARDRVVTAVVNGADFSDDGGCDAVALTPGDSCTLQVTFAPSGTPGTRTATIDVTDEGGATGTRELVGEAL